MGFKGRFKVITMF